MKSPAAAVSMLVCDFFVYVHVHVWFHSFDCFMVLQRDHEDKTSSCLL